MMNGNETQVILISIAYFGLIRVTRCEESNLRYRHLPEQTTRSVEGELAKNSVGSTSSSITSARTGLHTPLASLGGDDASQELRNDAQAASSNQHLTQNGDQNYIPFEFPNDVAEFGDWTLQSGGRGLFENFIDESSLAFIGNGNAS